jgi:hypothetical protein
MVRDLLKYLIHTNQTICLAYLKFCRQKEYREIVLPSVNDSISKFCSPEILNNKKRLRSIKADAMHCYILYGTAFDEYFLFNFEALSPEERKTFITENNRLAYYGVLTDPEAAVVFDNKALTYQKFGEYFHREQIAVDKNTQPKDLSAFVERHNMFILKPLSMYCGIGVRILDTATSTPEQIYGLVIQQAPCVLEELIRQSDEMGKFNPTSVNTVRITTLVTKSNPSKDDIFLFAPFVRFGRKGSVVDNVGSGGVFALVDPETGVIISDCVDKQGHRYIRHPDSLVQIQGTQLPSWKEAGDLARELSMYVPTCRFVGWDFAFTKDGWILVEGNSKSQINVTQICDRVGRKPLLDRLLGKSACAP